MDRLTLLTKIKNKVQSWMKTEARMVHRVGLTPNHISGLGIILGVTSALAYWKAGLSIAISGLFYTYILTAVTLLLTSGFLDALDGVLARQFGETSKMGGFLDSLLDRYVDAAIYTSLILGGLCDPLWGLLALIGSFLTSYSRALSEAAGVPMETIGVIERAERLLVLLVASVLTIIWIDTIRWTIFLLALLTNFTVIQRAFHFFTKLRSLSP